MEKKIERMIEEKNHDDIPSKYQYLMRKDNQHFLSYYPHYLHSFSYPIPVTPHLYFGQFEENSKKIVFLEEDILTISGKDFIDGMIFINGEQQAGFSNLFDTSIKPKIEPQNLKFMMAFQNQNMLPQNISTSVIGYSFGTYVGIISVLGKSHAKGFIVYFLDNEGNPINFNDPPKGLNIQFFNQSTYLKNKDSWRTGRLFKATFVHQLQSKKFNFDSKQLNQFNVLLMKFTYQTLKLAKDVKLYVDEVSNNSLEGIIEEIEREKEKKRIPVHARNLKPKTSMKCDSQAERQLFAGLSYQFGNLQLKDGKHFIENQPKQLLSFTPSRKRFPWGFLWDDGFHCEVAVRKNPKIAIQVIQSWLNTITDFGWIPREQNRGKERQYLCSCPLFMAKDVKDGNPPTLILSLNYLSRNNKLSYEIFSQKSYSNLKAWYQWFISTQQTSEGSYIFKWHDSIQGDGSFNSGLDDFPRYFNTFAHIDCQAWIYYLANCISKISSSLQEKQEQSFFKNQAQKIKQKLLQNFIEPQTHLPKDKLSNNSYSKHFGYPSILPLAFGILKQNSLEYNSSIEAIKDELDTHHGLASLSKKNQHYLQNPGAYWRGPVWININYLFLRGLKLYYPSQQKLYQKLRDDLIETVCGNLEKRGYFFENYINGKGSFSFPFTGWTALIAIIISEQY